MVTRKKVFVLLGMIANPLITGAGEDYDSGKAKIVRIMSHEETGIAAYNKNHIKYAETQNIVGDLDIEKMAEFFDCKTIIGRSFIAETLKFPVSSQDKDTVLARRQQVIKALVENPDLKKDIEKLLEQARQEEQEVVKLLSEFFIGQTCPELKNLELIKQQNPKMAPVVEFFISNGTVKSVVTALNTVSLGGILCTTGYFAKATYAIAKMGFDYKSSALYTGYLGLLSGLSTYGTYKDYAMASEKRSKLYALHQLIAIAEKFESLCAQHDISNQFNISTIEDVQGKQLIKNLKHKRYAHKNTKLFATPLVHTFLYQVYQQEKHLAQVLACIAEMDAYNALATKILEGQNTKNKFCFVNFVENAKPVVKAKGFWNILVQNAVPNSIHENRHVILTGPNAGGKTTAIRAILQNIVLGQTFGIAAAEAFEITMFDVIHSYLRISDDILNGLSLFASEVKRAQEILQTIKSLEPDKKFFFALDELFTGTAAEDGELCAYEFVKKMSEFDGVQFIYATHFNKLKELGKDNDICVNYKVDAPTKNVKGKLVYPYTLSLGANESRVALDLAREAQLFA